MLELRPGFDEGAYGFSKFSRFLRQAHDAEVINLNKVENGSYEVTLGAGAPRIEATAAPQRVERDAAGEPERERDRGRRRGRDRHRNGRDREREPRAEAAATPAPSAAAVEKQPEPEVAPVKAEKPTAAAPAKPAAPEPVKAEPAKPQPVAAAPAAGAPKPAISLGFRRGSRRGAAPPAPPPILAGQSVGPAPAKQPIQEAPVAAAAAEPAAPAKTARRRAGARERVATVAADGRGDGKAAGIEGMNLPKDAAQIVERLAGYRGVGRKSAEAAVQAFGNEVFKVLHDQPERVRQTMGARRAEQLLKGWQLDYENGSGGARKQSTRKRPNAAEAQAPSEGEAQPSARKQQRGGAKSGSRKKVARAGK
jgi:hypothetical protein